MHAINKHDVLALIDITALVVGNNPATRHARERFFDGVDCLFFEGNLGICTVRDALRHQDWIVTATLLDNASGSDPVRTAAARRALRAIHETAFGKLEPCAHCERQATFRPIAQRIRTTPESEGKLPDVTTVLGRIELALRSMPPRDGGLER